MIVFLVHLCICLFYFKYVVLSINTL